MMDILMLAALVIGACLLAPFLIVMALGLAVVGGGMLLVACCAIVSAPFVYLRVFVRWLVSKRGARKR